MVRKIRDRGYMMTRKAIVRGKGTTRQAILAAARKRFATASYDDVGLRDLAADVGVDVAYVHRCFGSKKQLFRKVLDAGKGDFEIAAIDETKLASELARALFDREWASACDEPDPLLVMVQSLASPTAGRMVGERLAEDAIEPLRRKIGDASPLRAALILSLLIGFDILDKLVELPEVTEADPERAEALVARAIDALLDLGEPADRL